MSAETVGKQDGYVHRRQQFSREKHQKEKRREITSQKKRYVQKLWNITVAPSSNGEQRLVWTVLPSLPQSLREGPHGRGLLLIHRSVTQLTKKARKSLSGTSIPPGLACSSCNQLRHCCLGPGGAPFLHKGKFHLQSTTRSFWQPKAVQWSFSALRV